jgi:DNA-binding transcriptional regulator GbsR (MarR family)
MQLADAKASFVQTWGTSGSAWGINRTMAQIHALLLVADKPLSTEDVMEQLSVSRGNANQNLRELINWQLVEKVLVNGERREFFIAEKDIWEVARRIMRERKRRELDPVRQTMEKLQKTEITGGTNSEQAAFLDTVKNMDRFLARMDTLSELVLKADESRLFGPILKLLK